MYSELLKNAEETRTLYKYLKSSHLGNSSVDFYLQFAKMEQDSGNTSKAESVLKSGLEVLRNNFQLCAAMESLKVLGSFKCPSKLPLSQVALPLAHTNILMTPASMENMQSQESFAKPRVKRLGLTGPPKRVNKDLPTSPLPPATSHSQLVLETPTPPSPRILKRTLIDSPIPKKSEVKKTKNESLSDSENDNSMSLTTIVVNQENAAAKTQSPPAPAEENVVTAAVKASTSVKSRIIKMGSKSYRVLQMVGRGGSSKVYKVLSLQDSQILALKKVNLRNLDEATLSGYINEIDLLSKFKDAQTPFIIKLVEYELNREQGYLLILMECGESDLCRMLQERAKSKLPVNYNFIRYYFSQMIHAVKIVHEAKIVHCDLKPANFLLVQGQLKLIDFGISKAIMNDTTNVLRENQVGTVNYMSPEALQETNCSTLSSGEKGVLKIGRPSDIWSLGCILFEMAFGRPPFAHLSLVQRLQRIMDPSVPIEYPQCDNPDLIECIKGCLIRAPKLRYSLDQLISHSFLMPPIFNQSEVVLVRREQVEELLRLFSERVPGMDTKHLSDRIFREWAKK